MTEEKHPGGRPLKFPTVEDLQQKIDIYFASLVNDEGLQIRPALITGLALALDTSRETLLNYASRDEYFDTVARAKLKCECYAEEQLFVGRNPSGAQFALKNYGWKDTHENNNTGSMTVNWPLGKSKLDE